MSQTEESLPQKYRSVSELVENTMRKLSGSEDLDNILAELKACGAELENQEKEIDQAHKQLLLQQKRYEQLFNSAPDGYLTTTANGLITDCNLATATLLDMPRLHLVGKSLSTFIVIEDRLLLKENLAACLESEGPRRFETQLQDANGKKITTFVTLTCPHTDGNEIQELHWLFQDISSRIHVEEKHSQLTAIVESSNDAMINTTANGVITNWNEGAEYLFGYDKTEMIGQAFVNLVPEEVKSTIFEIFNKRKTKTLNELDFPILAKYDQKKYVKLILTHVKDRKDKVSGYSAVFRDMTAEKQNEKDMRNYLSKLVDIQEKERARIAQELHDGTGQHLAAVGLSLGAIINNYDQSVPIEKKLENLQLMIKELGKEIHNVAWELRPPSLGKHGLVPALKHYTEIWSNRTGVQVEFLATGMDEVRAASSTETALFRIVQESFTNIAKHARASKVNVILQQHKTEIHLVVEDNGEGFHSENEKKDSGQSMGLSGMKERASLAGGSFQIESSHGHGTAIFVRVPFEKRD